MTWQFFSVLPVWLLSIVGAIVVGVAVPHDSYFTGVVIVLAAAVIATFAIQLALQRTEGFVVRAMASIGVSVVILAIATGVLALVG
ncbi:hypothetical protein BH11ACT4_BH11ACT4_23230 [soil metagenome]